MRRIMVICVGKLKEKFYREAAAEYSKRLGRYCKLELVELPERRLSGDPSPAEIEQALAREAEEIRARLPAGASLAVLCVEGALQSSEEFSRLLAGWDQLGEKALVFVIGGSYGIHASLKKEAWARISLSPMTFPHHLARVIVLEQIYRGYQILEGGKYHK